ncbi:MAG: hypothetical protein ACRC3B_23045 [Bacteroidia bacterium]
MRNALPQSKSRLLNTAFLCGTAGLLFFILAATYHRTHPEEGKLFLSVVFWINLFLQPLCLGAVWLTRRAPRNLAFRIFVWLYIIACAAYIVFPVGLKLLIR